MTDFGATQRVPSPGHKVFQRYTLKKILGRGGMGVVWLAHDDKLDRNVALKFLPDVVVHDPRAIDELKKEARRNLDLTHPHIVRIYDFVDDNEGAAIAMEYVKGDSLSKLALSQPDGTFTLNRIRPWVQQVCAALTYAHEEAKVVHRDLKPANLMLDGQDRVKITDFGIARSIAESVSRVSAQAGSSGTPSYMSPQQMMGELPSVADDVYSVGATLYELLTGKPPFYTGDVIAQVQGKVPPTVSQRRRELGLVDPPLGGPFITPDWEETIAACLAKEREDRPESAADVAERLGLKERDQKVRPAKLRPTKPFGAPPPPPPPVAAPAGKMPLYSAIAIGVALLVVGIWYLAGHRGGSNDGPKYSTGNQPTAATAPAEQFPQTAKPTPVPVAPPATVPTLGGLVVRTDPPGAEVSVGSLDHGKSPITYRDVQPGKYSVRVSAPGYEDWTRDVEVKADKFAEIDATLVQSFGRLVIQGAPTGAEVRDGERRLGTLPLTLDHFSAGPVHLTVVAKGYQSSDVTGTLARNGELRLTAVLDKIPVLEPTQRWTIAELKLEMVPVPAGKFTMGSSGGDWDEKPLTQVTISHPFWLGRTELTQAQWNVVMDRNPASFKGADHPVEQVSWIEAVEFCRRLTERGHAAGWLPPAYAFTLPTEAQWEYACRAGTTDDFGGGPDAVSWYSSNSSNQTQPVGLKKANAWGLADMHGNVWEWCLDWYDHLAGGNVTDPTGAASGTRRVIRGGSWSSQSGRCRASVRDAWKPGERGNSVGFRLALNPAATP